jgi:hypothetical protein
MASNREVFNMIDFHIVENNNFACFWIISIRGCPQISEPKHDELQTVLFGFCGSRGIIKLTDSDRVYFSVRV